MTRFVLGLVGAALAFNAAASHAAAVAGKVVVDGQPASDVVVYLEGNAGAASPPETNHAVMDQRNLEFIPRVLPVVRGTTIEFTNSDDIQHNVFSPSDSAGRFDLGTYGPGADRRVRLDQPGEVLVLCNIHMEMEARILVLRDPYFARTGTDGTYRIAAVPPGTYTAKLWRDGFLPQTQTVDVPADGELALDLQVAQKRGRP